ncbi:MAG: protein-L-isoaspartate O-methyltransferase [Alphaproteobacteria bacterium]
MDFSSARGRMVTNQIRTNHVTDPLVVAAISGLPREEFVPGACRGIAYMDADLDLGAGRHLMEPMVFARLLQIAAIQPGDVVLDIGCATGYSAGVLARMAGTVLAVECDPRLAEAATEALNALSIDNAAVMVGPLAEGYPAQAPYDVIVFEGSVPRIPDRIRDQLAEGGRLVAVVRDGGVGEATLITRVGGVFGHRTAFEASVGKLPGFERDAGFVF